LKEDVVNGMRMALGLGLACAAAAAAGAETVTLLAEAEVGGPYVRLIEIVDARGLSADRAAAWRDIFLGKADVGAERTIGLEEIRAELRKRGPDADAVEWAGAESVTVTARAGAAAPAPPAPELRAALRARRTLLPGAVLRPGDVEAVSVPVSELPSGALAAPEAAAGLRARTRIEKGAILTAARLQPPPVVRPGDAVTVTLRDDVRRAALAYAAQALDAGAPGDWIRVQHLETRRTGTACVTGAGAAEVLVTADSTDSK
jgi:flagella basal body P-ring formation protein FlgA